MTPEEKREYERVRQRTWRAANPEKVSATNRRWREAHPDRHKANKDKWAAANPGGNTATKRAWYAANRERSRAIMADRRARKKAAFVESVNPVVVYERDRGVCQICECWVLADEKWHVDHIMPLSRGGEHSYANTQLAHARCNMVKSAKVPA